MHIGHSISFVICTLNNLRKRQRKILCGQPQKRFYFDAGTSSGRLSQSPIDNNYPLRIHNISRSIHYTEEGFKMRVVASRPIKSGAQIFNSYTDILDPVQVRKKHLEETKNMLCRFGGNTKTLS